MEHKKVRVVLYQESGWWVAQCLEYDIRAQAKTISLVWDYITIAVEETRLDSKKRHGKAFAHIGPAPEYFEKMWKERAAALRPRRVSKSKAPRMFEGNRPFSVALA